MLNWYYFVDLPFFLILKILAMTKLSVNVNKIATLRNSRGGDFPNVVKVSSDIQDF